MSGVQQPPNPHKITVGQEQNIPRVKKHHVLEDSWKVTYFQQRSPHGIKVSAVEREARLPAIGNLRCGELQLTASPSRHVCWKYDHVI